MLLRRGLVFNLYIQFTRPRLHQGLNPWHAKSSGPSNSVDAEADCPVASDTVGARTSFPSAVRWEEPLDAIKSGAIS